MPCHLRSSLPLCALIPLPARIILCSCLYLQPSLLVLLYNPSVSFAPATISLPLFSHSLFDFSTYDPLYLPASFTREDSLVRLLPLFPLSPPSLLRCLAFFKASPWWLFFSLRRVLGTVLMPLARAEKWRLERALQDRLRMVKRWEAPGQPSPTALRARAHPWIMQNFLRFSMRYSWNATLKMHATGVNQQQFLLASLLQSEKLHSSIVDRLIDFRSSMN